MYHTMFLLTTFLLFLNSSSVLFFGLTNADLLLCILPINLVKNDVTSVAVLNRSLRFLAFDVASNSTDAILKNKFGHINTQKCYCSSKYPSCNI